jgi:hypothetical protein
MKLPLEGRRTYLLVDGGMSASGWSKAPLLARSRDPSQRCAARELFSISNFSGLVKRFFTIESKIKIAFTFAKSMQCICCQKKLKIEKLHIDKQVLECAAGVEQNTAFIWKIFYL